MLSWAGGGAQRPVLGFHEPNKTGACSARARSLIPPRAELESEKKEENNVEEETEWSITQWKVRVHCVLRKLG
jgi:hypothetical protein